MSSDFDADDGEVLASLSDETIVANHELDDDVVLVERGDKWHVFEPWDDTKPQWQIQSLLDAVREKGLLNEFSRILYAMIDPDGHKTESETGNDVLIGIRLSTYAPPEAICGAILELEGE